MYVKICGIRRQEDALMAAELGTDAIGLLVGQRHNSPDFISATLLSVSRAARLKNESLEDSANLPDPYIIAAEWSEWDERHRR
jgi:phosphoribosylanthranilate isomerase